MAISFKPWHGQTYKRFNILANVKGKEKRIGRILAPNEELALIKARSNFPNHKQIAVKERPNKPKKR